MERMIFALVVGQIKGGAMDFYAKKNTKVGNWLLSRAHENGFFFETEEETEAFRKDVLEFAKRLYEERKKKED